MKKNYLYLFGTLIVLLFVSYLVMQRQGEQNISTDAGEQFVSLDSNAVDKIIVSSASSSVTMEKQGGEWLITQPIRFNADRTMLPDIVGRVKGLKITSIVSSNPEKQSLFRVDSTGTCVSIFENGAQKISFYVGKAGPSYSETYLRKENDRNVVLVNAELSSIFNKTVTEWRDKTILTVPQEKINKISYQYGDTAFSLNQKEGTWFLENDTVQSNVVSPVISSLSDLKADDFLDTASSPANKIQAQITVANTQLVFSFDKKGNKYYVRSSNTPQWYVLQPWKAEQILKRKKEFIKK